MVVKGETALHVCDSEEARSADHATWRRIMERTERMLDELGPSIHPGYIDGWQRLGLRHESIPTLEEVNEALAPTQWQIVGVDGYIPTSTYVGMMSRRVFPVSRGLRRARG